MQGEVLVQLIGGRGGHTTGGVAGTERGGRKAWAEDGGGEEGGALVSGGGEGKTRGSGADGARGQEKRRVGGGEVRGGSSPPPVVSSLLSRWRSGWGRAWAKKPPAGGPQGGATLREDCSYYPPPLFILAVSIVEVTLYLWVGASDASVEGVTLSGFPPPPPSLAPPPSPLGGQTPPPAAPAHPPAPPSSQLRRLLLYDPHRRWEAWRFATYMLLHTGALHLALNVAIQAVLATPLEAEQGHLRTGLVYIGGGLGGSLSTSMLEPEIYIVGASGGVYALLISQLANVLLNFRRLRYKAYRAVAVAVISLADVAFSVYHFVRRGNECPRIGWAAHTGGALAGLLLGLLLFRSDADDADGGPRGGGEDDEGGGRRRPLRRLLAAHRAVRWVATLVLCAFVTAAVVTNVLHPETTEVVDDFVPPSRNPE